jgi:hypothetical protein
MPNVPNVPAMLNIEWLETLLATLALISAAVSVRLHARAGSAAAATLFFLSLLMISMVIEAMSGTTPPTVAWPPQLN